MFQQAAAAHPCRPAVAADRPSRLSPAPVPARSRTRRVSTSAGALRRNTAGRRRGLRSDNVARKAREPDCLARPGRFPGKAFRRLAQIVTQEFPAKHAAKKRVAAGIEGGAPQGLSNNCRPLRRALTHFEHFFGRRTENHEKTDETPSTKVGSIRIFMVI